MLKPGSESVNILTWESNLVMCIKIERKSWALKDPWILHRKLGQESADGSQKWKIPWRKQAGSTAIAVFNCWQRLFYIKNCSPRPTRQCLTRKGVNKVIYSLCDNYYSTLSVDKWTQECKKAKCRTAIRNNLTVYWFLAFHFCFPPSTRNKTQASWLCPFNPSQILSIKNPELHNKPLYQPNHFPPMDMFKGRGENPCNEIISNREWN